MVAALNEIAISSEEGIELEDDLVPVDPTVRATCKILGIDPFAVANEGKLVAIVPEKYSDMILYSMIHHPLGKEVVRIGKIVETYKGMVLSQTRIGGKRIVDWPPGELLPRIC